MLILLGTAVAGCAVVNMFGSAPAFGFSHRVHAKEGLECVDCHTAWNSAENPGMPARGGCVLCHENIDANKPPERHIGVLFEGDAYKVAHGTQLADEVLFSHQRHAAKPIDCQACHVGAAES
ncbi:MAG TPA: cytochrome c3 family protein, partial [Planctomycetota bacterium]|nr:cytochrome c3 family protein [Planctomycetota bacterium]